MRTSSFRLAALYSTVTAAAFLVLLLIIYWIASEALARQLSDGVIAEFASLMNDSKGGDARALAAEISVRTARNLAPTYLYFLSDNGGWRLAGNCNISRIFDGWRQESLDEATREMLFGSKDVDDDHELVGYGRHLPDGSFVFVGEDNNRILAAQEAIVQAFGWASGLAVALSILVGLLASRGFLKRIDAINATTQAIMAGQLKERIPVLETSDELDRLAENLNRMLDGNHALMESLKQVSSSLAHDLKTPLTRLRQDLEGARLNATSEDEFRAAIDRAIENSDTILATFSALLRIAQIESGSRKAGFKTVSLSAIIQRIAEAYGPVAEDDRRSFVRTIEPGLDFLGDEDLLIQMLANLVENCLHHTPEGTAISISLAQADDRIQATVADKGPGVPTWEYHRIFERFYQLDHSRSSGGSGLGLALVAAVAELHGISVVLADNGPGLIVRLDFGPSPPRNKAASARPSLVITKLDRIDGRKLGPAHLQQQVVDGQPRRV